MRAAAALPVLALSACAAGQVKLGEEFTLPQGHEALVTGPELRVAFDSVAEDSRCPAGATCIWEGNARVLLRVRKAHSPDTKAADRALELNTSARLGQKGEFEGYVVELRRLEPVRSTDTPTPPYAATLVVSPK